MTDIEIANATQMLEISEVAKKLGLSDKDIDPYGHYKAKINVKPNDKKGKLILVTAINPTSLGEGKTTTSIGLADGMAKIGKKVCLALREPSLGPVFGIKGGATGGGHAQVLPMEDINLNFTGDLHAVTTANNLIAAILLYPCCVQAARVSRRSFCSSRCNSRLSSASYLRNLLRDFQIYNPYCYTPLPFF